MWRTLKSTTYSEDFVEHEDVFILRVKGDSMIEAGTIGICPR